MTLSVRLPTKDIEGIEFCLKEGFANNKSDFVKQAIRDRITKCKEENA